MHGDKSVGHVEPIRDVAVPVNSFFELAGYLYRPLGTGPFPAVVLMHNCAGVEGTITAMENVAFQLRDAGYVALVEDSFSERHVSFVCDDPAHKPPTSPGRVEDAFAASRYLASLAFVDANRIGLVGWSHACACCPPIDGGAGALQRPPITLARASHFPPELGSEATARPVTRRSTAHEWPLGSYAPGQLAEWVANIPIGRVGRGEDVAGLAALVASEDAAYTTGRPSTSTGVCSCRKQRRKEEVPWRPQRSRRKSR